MHGWKPLALWPASRVVVPVVFSCDDACVGFRAARIPTPSQISGLSVRQIESIKPPGSGVEVSVWGAHGAGEAASSTFGSSLKATRQTHYANMWSCKTRGYSTRPLPCRLKKLSAFSGFVCGSILGPAPMEPFVLFDIDARACKSSSEVAWT